MFTKKRVAPDAQDLRPPHEELVQSIQALQPPAWLNTVGQNLQCWRALLSEPKLADPRRLERFGHKCYSQNDEDGAAPTGGGSRARYGVCQRSSACASRRPTKGVGKRRS
jgi:hypothetical protein